MFDSVKRALFLSLLRRFLNKELIAHLREAEEVLNNPNLNDLEKRQLLDRVYDSLRKNL